MKVGQIPKDYIEDADYYKIMPLDTQLSIELGGRIMLNLVVFEQMTVDNIVATSGLKKKEGEFGKSICIIVVSYTAREVIEKINNAKRLSGKLIDEGGDLNASKKN